MLMQNGNQVMPDWFSVEGNMLYFTNVDYNSAGDYQIKIVATDDSGKTSEETGTLTIFDVNRLPIFGELEDIIIDECETRIIQLDISDPDDDELSISMKLFKNELEVESNWVVLREEDKGTISWRLKFRDGREKNFESPIRTTAWGSIKCASEYDAPLSDAINSQELAHEPEFLKVDQGLPSVTVDQFVKYELASDTKSKKSSKKLAAHAAE